MTAALSVTPTPAAPSAKVTASGSGVQNRSTRLRLQGSVVAGSFLPGADGAFTRQVTAPASAGSYALELQQKIRGWQTVVTGQVVVQGVSPTPVPEPTPDPAPTPGTVARPTSLSAFLSDLSGPFDVIELTGTLPWDGVPINVDRTARPLLIRPAPGQTVTFTGDGATSEGTFFIGRDAYTAHITFDGVVPGGLQFTGIEYAAAGVWEVRSSSHVTIANCRYTNIRRSTTIGDGPAPWKTWIFYVSMAGGRNNADLWIHHQKVDAPAINRNHSFANNGSSTLVNGNITFEDIDLAGLCYGFYGDVANGASSLTLDRWNMVNVGYAGTPSSIRFTAKAIRGVYRNITAKSSDPVHNASTAPMVNGGGVVFA